MNRLSALTLLLATLSATSLHAADAQRQQLNRDLKDTVAATAGPKTTTIAPSSGATADGSDDLTMSPSDASSDASSTVSKTEGGSTETPTQDASTETPTQDASTESPTQDASTETRSKDASTANPTQDASTANPTDEDSTVSPTEEDSTITPSTAIPSTLMPQARKITESPIITEAPTEGEVPEISFAPTEVPTADMTVSPTEADEEPEVESDCQENPKKYEVMVDLQIDFEDQVVLTCTPDEEQTIAVTISETMNQAFPERVPGWDGAAEFGAFDFDDQQTYDMLSEIAGARQLRGRMLEAVKRLVSKRRRADVLACPIRGDLACPNEYCMWGCVQADTTLCGEDDSTDDWVDMGEDIKQNLFNLAADLGGFNCLGQLQHLNVLVTLEEGTLSAPSAAPSEEFKIRGNFVTDAPTPAPTFMVFEDKGPEVIHFTTKLFVTYFRNQGGDLDGHTDVELQLMDVLAKFIESTIYNIPKYKAHFNGMKETDLDHSWDESSRELTLTFSTNIYFTESDGETNHDLAHDITTVGDFHTFIQRLREHKCEQHVPEAECKQWMSGIGGIKFQGTGSGRRLEMVEAMEEELA